jgi:hypothetical protein
VLDQEVAPAGTVAEQGPNLVERLGIDDPTLRVRDRMPATLPGVNVGSPFRRSA